MSTRVIYFPREKDADLEVEVTRDGSIVSARGYCDVVWSYVDVLSRIQKCEIWLLRIEERFSELDWDDVDPRDPDEWDSSPLETIKDCLRPA